MEKKNLTKPNFIRVRPTTKGALKYKDLTLEDILKNVLKETTYSPDPLGYHLLSTLGLSEEPNVLKIVFNHECFFEWIANKVVTHTDLANVSTALAIRIQRFKIKYLTLLLYSKEFLHNPGLERKLYHTLAGLNKKLIVEYETPPFQGITLATTIALATKLIAAAEQDAKTVLEPIRLLLNCPPIYPLDNLMLNTIASLAPEGFLGVESDSYYILRLLLLGKNPPLFTEIQQKQWATYAHEIISVLRIIRTIDPSVDVLPRIISFKGTSINMPFSNFMLQKPHCSNNAFSRLINSSNFFIIHIWQLFFAIACEKLQPPVQKTE